MAKNLTQGPIFKSLIGLAIPIIGMSFVQMAYNMVDMIWLGRVGAQAVAAVGAASFLTWFGVSLHITMKTGAEIGVSQSIGQHKTKEASLYASNSVKLGLMLAALYGCITYIFAPELLGFFKLEEKGVLDMGASYLRIIAIGAPFYYVNPILGGVFTGAGESKLPFKITSMGLALNILIDPLFIFGIGSFEGWGSDGAAYATIISQFIVSLLFYRLIYKGKSIIEMSRSGLKLSRDIIVRILRLGVPVAAQSLLFSIFAMIIARIVTKWGALPIAVQSVGAQIEALSWMTAGGLSTALASFTGQNFGAKQWNRIYKGFLTTVSLSAFVGGLVGLMFWFGGETIFGWFIPEEEAIILGGQYLAILSISQLFMCLEITSAGAFYGMGKTGIPSIVSIIFTGSRIPLALWLSADTVLGLHGVWWAISISSVFKGVILFVAFFIVIKRYRMGTDHSNSSSRKWIRLVPNRIRQQFIGNEMDVER